MRARQERGESDSSPALDHEPEPLHGVAHRPRDVGFSNGRVFIDQFLYQPKGMLVVEADPSGKGVRQGLLLRNLDGPPRSHAREHDRGVLGRDGDVPRSRRAEKLGKGRRDPADEPAARERYDHGRRHLPELFQDLPRDRPLPRDDLGVVVG